MIGIVSRLVIVRRVRVAGSVAASVAAIVTVSRLVPVAAIVTVSRMVIVRRVRVVSVAASAAAIVIVSRLVPVAIVIASRYGDRAPREGGERRSFGAGRS